MIQADSPTVGKASSDEGIDAVLKILNNMKQEADLAASLRAANINSELAAFVQSFVSNPVLHELKEQKKRIQDSVKLKLVAFLVFLDGNVKLKNAIDQVKYSYGESTLTLWVFLRENAWNRETRIDLYGIESALRGIRELSHIKLDFMVFPKGLEEVPSNLTILPLPQHANQ